MRVLRIARSSARRSRTQALNQMRSIICTAPDDIRDELRHLGVPQMLAKASAYRPRDRGSVAGATRFTLRMLARRAMALETEVNEIDTILKDLVAETAPELVEPHRVTRRLDLLGGWSHVRATTSGEVSGRAS